MFKNILLLVLVIVLAWMSQDYFSTTLPKQDAVMHRTYQNEKQEATVHLKPSSKTNSVTDNEESMTLSMLLQQDRFYEAIEFILDSEEKERNSKEMLVYLTRLVGTDVAKAFVYMRAYLDEVEDPEVFTLMVDTYISQEEYKTAIELIIQAKEIYVSEKEDKRSSIQLREVAVQYIDKLIHKKEYAMLIAFLEEMIAYDGEDSFYSYRLAQLYMELDKVEEAEVLLEALQYDEVYAQNVKTLLNSIDKEEEEEYQYAIPLQRYGDHYIASVFLDDTAFNLILDTGATYIFIDEDKASMLEVIRDDLVLQTAGNDVRAKLGRAESLRIGNLALSNIEVTIAPFKREGIDGLLGMNFFKQFRFYINQEDNVLYLNPKNKIEN